MGPRPDGSSSRRSFERARHGEVIGKPSSRRWAVPDPTASTPAHTGVRLADLVATLSLATDLGLGQPMEHCLRQTLVALRLADRVGLEPAERAVTYYVSLLAWVTCHVDSFEQAEWFGDDIAYRAGTYQYDATGLSEAVHVLRRVGAGQGPLTRARRVTAFLTGGYRTAEAFPVSHCTLAAGFAGRLGLDPAASAALLQAFERWDGKGQPAGLAGEQILLPVRLVQLADVVDVHHRAGGVKAAREVARARSGTQFDPALADLFCDQAPELLAGLDRVSSWDAVIEGEPALIRTVDDDGLDGILEAIGDLADMKTPYTAGHSRGVAELAAAAAAEIGIPESERKTLWRAALLHDIGRIGVSNAIWDKRGPLTATEFERVRLHPYLTDRMLACSIALAPLRGLAGRHHERLDGSGYPRGLTASALGPCDRVLAAADAYRAMREPRPHRRSLDPAEAADQLQREVTAGKLDGAAVNAVLRAGGHRVRSRRRWPNGLTAREVEVLALLARGHQNRQIARVLYISPKTVGNHIESIYLKIRVSTRAAATLFAAQHDLLSDYPPDRSSPPLSPPRSPSTPRQGGRAGN
jgi:HD-GYP domain-containing protein (c-di-GMP phosphodiesterase class II)